MKKRLLFALAVASAFTTTAQYVVDFQTIGLASDTAWFGQDQVTDGDTTYVESVASFELNYNSGWGSHSGWAVSNQTDTTTPGYGNQFSAITGTGADGTDQYGVCFASNWSNNRVFIDPGSYFINAQFTNTTYAYYSMLNGDSFAKPFGADTAANGTIDGTNGEDWFLLTIYGLDVDSLHNGDSVNFYLADYRFANDADDYIVDTWETVDLSIFAGNGVGGYAAGLDFVLTSSDTTGGWGSNTPAYFAMDRLVLGASSLDEYKKEAVKAYPNPTTSSLNIETAAAEKLELYDLQGRMVLSTKVEAIQTQLDLSDLPLGVYQLHLIADNNRRVTKIVKQ